MQRSGDLREPLDESAIIRGEPKERPELGAIRRDRSASDCVDLFFVNPHPMLIHNVPQKLDPGLEELALPQLHTNTLGGELLKHFFKVEEVLCD